MTYSTVNTVVIYPRYFGWPGNFPVSIYTRFYHTLSFEFLRNFVTPIES